MTTEELDHLADDVPDSKRTESRDVLFFYADTTPKEAIKKLKNHKFKLGYTYDIELGSEKYVRIVCYNVKNDIFRGWFKYDSNGDGGLVFPDDLYTFPSLITAVRYVKNKKGDGQSLKVFRENCHQSLVKGSNGYGKFGGLEFVKTIDNLDYYNNYFPILENPEVENQRLLNILNGEKDKTFYSDVALLCNIYKFNETYELLDDGLKHMYSLLAENYEKVFCDELKKYLKERELVNEVVFSLNIGVEELMNIFERNGYDFLKECKSVDFQGKKTDSLMNKIKILLPKK